METIGPSELLIILLVLVAIFGASRLPKMARSLGEGIRAFRTALRDASNPSDGDRADGDSATNTAATERPVKNGDPSRSTP
jgi:sec-independent protein translocase protein TatA